jgi:hypothetical protein
LPSASSPERAIRSRSPAWAAESSSAIGVLLDAVELDGSRQT